MNRVKYLKEFEEYDNYPFLEKSVEKVDIPTIMLRLSKASQNFVKYMLDRDQFRQEKIIIDIDDFLNVSGYKTRAVAFKILKELCEKDILARTKYSCIYWVNNGIIDERFLSKKNKK
uniref:hypothetical protein n=1 Tax=Cardinium endosymbiont of Bemisia tabaci TaxID=672794 RepID=UPI000442CF32|nr:hypothetical protein [Cardinium endosymbiont of Bemisia tabaci]CDG50370.1 Hypothetical protein CHV_p005 [Cardinium endosymbiont cBtQ1 of Bemisia tabaci]